MGARTDGEGWLKTKTGIATALLVILLLGLVKVAEAQTMGLGAPMTVRFTGTFSPWEKDTPGGPETLTVTVEDEKLFFHVMDVSSYEGSDPTMMLIQHIFPPVLEFLGPKHRLDPVAGATKGQKFAVEGWLYAGDNTFYVAAVKSLGK